MSLPNSSLSGSLTRRRFMRNAALAGAGAAGLAVSGCTKPVGDLEWIYWAEDDWFSVPYYANKMCVDYRAETDTIINAENRRFLVDPTNPEDIEGGFIADVAAGHPPDIEFLMSGIWGMNYFVFEGFMEPLDSHFSASETSSMINWGLDQYWDGSNYGVPWYLSDAPWLYNQDVLDAAGVSAPGANYTWDEFMTDCAAIKAAGYDPVVIGLEDFLMYGHLINQFCKTAVDSEQDFLKWCLGETSNGYDSFDNPGIVEALTKLGELASNGYINADYNTVGMFAGTDDACFNRFMAGGTAFIPTTSTFIPWISTAVPNLGACVTPVFGDGDWKDKHVVTAWANGVVASSANKSTGIDFLKFMRSTENMELMAANTGFIPAHNNLPSSVTDMFFPATAQCYEWAKSKPCAWLESFLPYDVNFESLVSIHGVIDGTMTPAEAAAYWADAAAAWRTSSEPMTAVSNVEKWVA